MRAAVVIGVDKVGGGLSKLSAASSGAQEIADWLGRNNYDVKLFTDKDGPVERSAIFKAVKAFVDAGNLERLLIYFGGHGFLKGPGDEYWLLSGAPEDAAEAVNVTLSSIMARYKGIPQIIFISDACRVVPKSTVHSGIVGAPIFPNTAAASASADVDCYYATHPGDPALERGDAEAKQAHGLFTQELLDAHRGAPPEALLAVQGRDYVRSRWLKQVLRDRVDLRAQDISLSLTQKPDVQLQSFDSYIAQNEVGASPPPPPDPTLLGSTKALPDIGASVQDDGIVRAEARTDAIFQARKQQFQDAGRQLTKDLEWVDRAGRSGAVLVCSGGRIEIAVDARLQVEDIGLLGAGSAFRFALGERAAQAAIRFEDGTGMLLPILQDYSCEIARHEGSVISIAYSWNEYRDPHLSDLRAEVLSAATLGLLSRRPAATVKFANRIRQSKRADPMLGIVAALAYALAGDFAGARSVRDYMRQDLGVDLFDAWLLGGAEDGPQRFPALPLLSQTWSFLDAFDTPVPEALKGLPRIPGFWTVFEAEAMERVMRIAGPLRQGEEMYS